VAAVRRWEARDDLKILIHRLRAVISRSGVKALENPAFVRRLDGEELLGSRRVIANLLSSAETP